MKLAKIEHIRCAEWSNTTYILIPDEMKDEEFYLAVLNAKAKYLAVLKNWNDRKPVEWPRNILIPGSPDEKFDYPPETTLAEIIADHRAKKSEWSKWERQKSEAIQSFGTFLKDEIPGSLYIWEDDESLSVKIDWGHRHGEDIHYGDSADNDLPGPSRITLSPEELKELETL